MADDETEVAVLREALAKQGLDLVDAAGGAFDRTILVSAVPGAGADESPTVIVDKSDEPTIATPGAGPSARELAAADGGASAGKAPRYVVVGLIGKGGMGIVHVARDVNLLRRVAIKELAEPAAREPTAAARFLREVQVTAQLDHPNVVPVYSLEHAAAGRPAYAMKLVEGITFEELVQQTRAFHERGEAPDEGRSLAGRLDHFLKVCDAVAYAHDRGVLHRDLKPPNLMLGAHNEVYVMDWGICRILGHDTKVSEPGPCHHHPERSPIATDPTAQTQLGAVVGTPMYMSPEQARGEASLDARSDQCALGLILFKLVTLRSPFAGNTGLEVLGAAAHGRRRAVEHEFGDAVAPELRAIVERATAPDPQQRYASVRAFADDLRRFLRGEAVEARPDTRWQRLVRRAARHRQAMATLFLAVLALASVAVVGLMWRHERALADARFREDRVREAAAALARQGDLLQTRVLLVLGKLDALAAVAGTALAGEQPAAPAVRLPGLDRGVSPGPGEGIFTADPAADPARVRRLAVRLSSAAPQQRELIEHAQRLLGAGEDALDLRVGLEGGLAFRYPPPAAAPPAVDPLTRPWYRAAASRIEAHWGDAYVDRGAVRLPFGAPIRSRGRLLGVISLVFAPERMLQAVLAQEQVAGARTTLLLDAQGRVMAAQGVTGTDSRQRLAPVDTEIRAALDRRASHLETSSGTPEVVLLDTVHPLEWTLVAIVPESALLDRSRESAGAP